MVLALIPLTVVLLAVRAADRWEPEPASLVVFALAWGAVVQAPLVEEFAKGLGVFVVFVFGRRAFDGPVDGVVCGALVGAGFAFTENILYFATSLIEGGLSETAFTFVLRGILSPFAHVMFTAVTGYAIGRAARAVADERARLGRTVAARAALFA
ncbi:PrsW family intramembrane metalloprotease [Microbacterium lacticum]|nr:PrsW family intramembrane metalloprotease [Microbacterium lacticum]